MAQAILRIFTPGIVESKGERLSRTVEVLVFCTHYPDLAESRTVDFTFPTRRPVMVLQPGDITLVVPVLNTRLSKSDADYEVEISEGSDNWPSRVANVQKRAVKLSKLLQIGFPELSHNIFDVTGIGTGWASYRLEKSNTPEGRSLKII